MTIPNKDWLTAEIARMYIEGHSQEEISVEFQIGEGTVNAIMQELLKSDNTLRLQHEIAVVCKKQGISIKQFASNLAFPNAIKKLGFDSNKIDLILQALHSVLTAEGTHSPDAAANLLVQLCNLIVKNHIPPNELYSELYGKYIELGELNKKVNETKKMLAELQNDKARALEEYNSTTQELQNVVKFRKTCEGVGIDLKDSVEVDNVLFVIEEMGKDPNMIIDEVKKIRPLKLEQMRVLDETDEIVRHLEEFKKKETEQRKFWGSYFSTVDLLNRLLMEGIDPNTMTDIIKIVSKHRRYLSSGELVRELVSDIDIYGSIKDTIFKMTREFDMFLTGMVNAGFSAATK